jgi:hypothetical protein
MYKARAAYAFTELSGTVEEVITAERQGSTTVSVKDDVPVGVNDTLLSEIEVT